MSLLKKDATKFGLVFFVFYFLLSGLCLADNPSFIVTIDAGHGGHDPGAVGSFSQEKKINLAIALAFGQMIEKNDPSVKVIFTRKTDVYLTLQERADVANNAHSDLFVCVHTNANNNSVASGAETYTLGLTKSKSNLDVAMRENSVILLEDDYKVKYEGFNPNSVDSYIMFECIQDKYLNKSVQIASDIQKNFVSSGRKDRGVRQAGFWVLHKTAMPSILVEVGYISNPEEEQFLNSEAGQQKMATAIYNAFEKFKHEYERQSGRQNYVNAIAQSDTDTQKVAASTSKNETLVKSEQKEKLSKKEKEKQKEKELAEQKEKEPAEAKEKEKVEQIARFDAAKAKADAEKAAADKAAADTEKAARLKAKADSAKAANIKAAEEMAAANKATPKAAPQVVVKSERVLHAETTAVAKPVVAETKKAVIAETKTADTKPQAASDAVVYKLQLFAVSKVLPVNSPNFKGLKATYFVENNLYKYTYGSATDIDEIRDVKQKIANKFPDAMIIAFKNGVKIPVPNK